MASRPLFTALMRSSCSRASALSIRSNMRCSAAPRFLKSLNQRPFSAYSALQAKKYTEDHEWIELDTDGVTGTIGISEYAANALGDVVYVELPTVESEFSAGDVIGAVESVKSASDLMTPVAGQILETNTTLEEKPGSINKSPEGDGWIVKIKVTNPNELDGLMDAAKYKTFTEE